MDEGLLDKTKDIWNEIKKTIVGKDEIVLKILMAVFADGHILIEDIPGVGKTTMALTFSKVLGLKCNRMQFTPDVMPSDVVGFNVYNREKSCFEYRDGAVIICFWQMRLTGHHLRHSQHFCRLWKRAVLQSMEWKDSFQSHLR